MNKHASTPTVESNPMLNLAKAAVILRKSLKKKDVDEEVVIAILTSCSNEQRHEMAKIYYRTNGRNLEKDLRRKFCGNLESLIVGLIYPPTDYFARQFYKALQGLEVDANTIIEVLVTKTDAEIKEIADSYEKAYKQSLIERLCTKTSGDFKKLLRLIVTRPRALEIEPSTNEACQLAREIIEAVETADQNTIVEIFVSIFAQENYQQLGLLFQQYKKLSIDPIEKTLKSKLSGNLLKLILAIVEYIQCPAVYFANQLHRAVGGSRTDDQTLIRIIISRCEIDLVDIKKEYKRLHKKSLKNDIKEGTSGNYRKALLQLIGGS